MRFKQRLGGGQGKEETEKTSAERPQEKGKRERGVTEEEMGGDRK